jgi:WD40 repeat protein
MLNHPVVAEVPQQPTLLLTQLPKPVHPAPPLNLTIRGHTATVNGASFSPNGKYIVSGSDDRDIQVWDAQTGNSVLGPLKMNSSVGAVFSQNGSRIAAGLYDGMILVLDAVTGEVIVGPLKGQFGYGMHRRELIS